MKSFCSVALVFALLANPLLSQEGPIRRQLRENLAKPFSGEIVAPLYIIRELSYQNAKSADFRDSHEIALQWSPVAQLAGADAYIKKVQADVFSFRQQVIEQSLQQVNPSPALVSLVSFTSDRSFAVLQQDLQRAAAINLKSLSAIQARLKPIQVSAIATVLKNFSSPADRKKAMAAAQEASVQIRQILSKRFLSQADISELQGQGKAILGALDADKLPAALKNIPDKDALIRVYYQNLSNLSTGISQQVATVIPAAQLPKLTSDQSVAVLQALGAMGNAHASLVHVIHDGEDTGRGFADQLAAGVKQLNSQWDQLPQNLAKVDPQTQAFITGFKGLVGNLHGDQAVDVPALASTLSAVGVFPRGSAVAQASSAITELIARKGEYATAAGGLIATLSMLDKAKITIPGISQVAPLLSAANSIFKAAGPLTTLAGFASGLGAFSMIGGLGGLTGGSNDAVEQALAQINQRLQAIEEKLDKVLEGLKQLDDKITKYHAEEMHALEGITFEVVRSHTLLAMAVHDKVGDPCMRAKDRFDQYQQDQLNACMNGLASAFPGPAPLSGTPKALSFELNVKAYKDGGDGQAAHPLEKTALDRFTEEVTFRTDLTALVGNANCQGLVYPSADLDSLAAKYAEYASRPQTANCPGILTANLVEPVITAQYITWEQDALAASASLPRAQALLWWQKTWPSLRVRLADKELPLLNSAIAQQAGVSGDVLIPSLSKKLDDAFTDAPALAALKKVWNVNGLLAENVARYWVWSRMKRPAPAAGDTSAPPRNTQWIRSLYALAWESGDETYWRAVTHLPAGAPVKFAMASRSPENGGGWIWTVQFRDLEPVPLPEPAEMNVLQLRWPTSLSILVEARARVIETLSGAEYVQETWKKRPEAAKDLLEAFAAATPKERLK